MENMKVKTSGREFPATNALITELIFDALNTKCIIVFKYIEEFSVKFNFTEVCVAAFLQFWISDNPEQIKSLEILANHFIRFYILNFLDLYLKNYS